jgi:hypothetical protein
VCGWKKPTLFGVRRPARRYDSADATTRRTTETQKCKTCVHIGSAVGARDAIAASIADDGAGGRGGRASPDLNRERARGRGERTTAEWLAAILERLQKKFIGQLKGKPIKCG